MCGVGAQFLVACCTRFVMQVWHCLGEAKIRIVVRRRHSACGPTENAVVVRTTDLDYPVALYSFLLKISKNGENLAVQILPESTYGLFSSISTKTDTL